MVVSLRSPRRLLGAAIVATFLFLFLALRRNESVVVVDVFPGRGHNEPAAASTPPPVSVKPSHHEDGDGGESQPAVVVSVEPTPNPNPNPLPNPNEDRELELVVASVKAENTSWFHTYLPDWHKNIYVADDAQAPLTVPRNKGREAMVYLTYLIDRYDDLPRNVLFVHASRFAWHNDDPDYDALPTLRRFRLPHLRASGYVNLRCVWVIGCPGEIRPALDAAAAAAQAQAGTADADAKLQAKHVYKEAFEALLPGVPVPELVAVSCCSQFGVTRETVRRRPREDYVRYREWLLATPLDDALNGRVFEFAWHIIFGKEAVHCPAAADCYCNTFGLCDMTCTDDACKDRYILPPYSSLPKGWPLVGWEQEERNFTGPLK